MKNLLTDYQAHEQALQKTIHGGAAAAASNEKKTNIKESAAADPEYVLEFGSHPDLSTLVNKKGSTSKSILTKYKTSAMLTEARSTRSIKFGANRTALKQK